MGGALAPQGREPAAARTMPERQVSAVHRDPVESGGRLEHAPRSLDPADERAQRACSALGGETGPQFPEKRVHGPDCNAFPVPEPPQEIERAARQERRGGRVVVSSGLVVPAFRRVHMDPDGGVLRGAHVGWQPCRPRFISPGAHSGGVPPVRELPRAPPRPPLDRR